mgnify:CR=1 FL=1
MGNEGGLAMTEKKQSVFETLSKIDVSNHIDVIPMNKGFSPKYVSWSWAWNYIKAKYPDTPTPKFETFPEMVLKTHKQSFKTKYGTMYKKIVDDWEITARYVPYLTTTTGTMVTCTVEIDGQKYTESLYVMDNKNKAVIDPDQSQINKTQKRCLVKTLAMAGLGLNLYAGEDLPMGDISEKDEKQAEAKKKTNTQQQQAKKPANKQHDNSLDANAERYKALVDEYAKVTGSSTKDVFAEVKNVMNSHSDYEQLSKNDKLKESIKFVDGMLKSAKQMKQEEQAG